MPKGNPNNGKIVKCVAKIYSPKDGVYKPIYTLPDATSSILGGVYLSDAVNDEKSDAAKGVVAATPKAVKLVQDNAETKLSKTTTEKQTVASEVSFGSPVTSEKGFIGNASSATKLLNERKISISGGKDTTPVEQTFDGTSDISFTLSQINAESVNVGTLPLSVIPQAALERVVTVTTMADAVNAVINGNAQNGDSIYVTHKGEDGVAPQMFYVQDVRGVTDVDHHDGLVEYQAGTASQLGVNDVGSGVKLMYLEKGTPKASGEKVGDVDQPVYLNDGTITKISHTIKKDVPADAVFTDTTYVDMVGSTTDADGASGLVPAPSAGDDDRFLCANGKWEVAGRVMSVSGSNDSDDDTKVGDVVLTAQRVGALPIVGGVLNGTLTAKDIIPDGNLSSDLGSDEAQWKDVYAETFHGKLDGEAETAASATVADGLNKSVKLTGTVSSNAVSLNNNTSTISLTTELEDHSVTFNKLAKNVMGVYVSSTEPTSDIADNIGLWVKI